MPNIKSAKKRMRQNEKRRLHSRRYIAASGTYEKKIRKFLLDNNLEQAKATFRLFTAIMDKAGKKKIIHKNKASRKKSQLATLINSIGKPGSEKSKDEQ